MLTELTELEFNEFSKNHPNSIFFQSSYWGKLKAFTGWKYYLVGLKEEDNIKAASLLLAKKIPIINKYIFYSPRGYLIDYNDFELLKKYTEKIVKFVKKKKGIFIKINPLVLYQQRDIDGNIIENGLNNKTIVENLKNLGYEHVGFTKTYGKDLEPRWISVLDLKDKTMDDIKSNLRRTTRLDVNNAYKHGLELVEIDENRLNEFKDLMAHTGERRGFIDRPLSYYKKMYEEFKTNDNIKVMLVELNIKNNLDTYKEKKANLEKKIEYEKSKERPKENLIKELEKQLESANKKMNQAEELLNTKGEKIVVAGGLFMNYGRQVVSLFGASYKEYMKYKGQYYLNNEMIKYAIENGYEKYNFYGITGDFSEDSPMFGLFDFKRGFGAEPVELIGEFTYITNKFYNNIYNLMHKAYVIMKKVKK